MLARSLPVKSREVWLVTYLILYPHVLVLFMTSQLYKLLSAKVQDVFLRLPECRFCTNRARNRLQKLLSVCFSFAVPVDRGPRSVLVSKRGA